MKSLKLLIKETITEFINDEIPFENLDLTNKENIVEWLKKHGPESLFDDDGELDWNSTDPMTGDDVETLIYSYMEKYNEISSESEIEIYRMLMLDTIKELDLNNVGVFWSFNEDGVGAYGTKGEPIGSKPFVLNAMVDTEDIDWPQGFYSFLAYGRSEFECYMNKGSKCLITHINEKRLKSPINAVC